MRQNNIISNELNLRRNGLIAARSFAKQYSLEVGPNGFPLDDGNLPSGISYPGQSDPPTAETSFNDRLQYLYGATHLWDRATNGQLVSAYSKQYSKIYGPYAPAEEELF